MWMVIMKGRRGETGKSERMMRLWRERRLKRMRRRSRRRWMMRRRWWWMWKGRLLFGGG